MCGVCEVPWHSPNLSVLTGIVVPPVHPWNAQPQSNSEQVLSLPNRLFCTTVNSEMLREDKQVSREGASPKIPDRQAKSVQPVPIPEP